MRHALGRRERAEADMRTAVAGMLAGKTAVVTGTAQGIGACIAAALRDDGATVHGVDRDGADHRHHQPQG